MIYLPALEDAGCVFPLEVFRVALVLPSAEFVRRTVGPARAIAWARGRGVRQPTRSEAGRARLKRVIRALDRRFPGGANCVRRSLIEAALDAGAARERLFAGFRAGGGPQSGHAWLESEPPTDSYDAVISL